MQEVFPEEFWAVQVIIPYRREKWYNFVRKAQKAQESYSLQGRMSTSFHCQRHDSGPVPLQQ